MTTGYALVLTLLPAYAADASSLRTIAAYGDPAPGEGGTFRNFLQLAGTDPAISGKNVAFAALAEEAGGIYAYIDGELRVIADTKTYVPGTKVRFGFPGLDGSGPSISGRNVAFGASIGLGPSIVAAYIDGSLQVIAVAGSTPAPGGDGTSCFRNFGLGNGVSPAISGRNVAFSALTEDFRLGIYAWIDGDFRLIADTTTPVPGVAPPTPFRNFRMLNGVSPAISGENVAFTGVWSATTTGSVAGGLDFGIFLYADGALRAIVRTGTPLPPDAASFCGTGFGGDGVPSISGENVAFRTGCGIFASINGELRVIADVDTPAPGTATTFGIFPSEAVISDQNVAFGSESIVGFGGGVFAHIDGKLRLIAGENTAVPGREELTFGRFFFTDGVHPAISGRNVVFTGDPNAVYAFFPRDKGDFDDDFCINLRDAAAVQNCFTGQDATFVDPQCTPLDFDSDQDVDLRDTASFTTALDNP